MEIALISRYDIDRSVTDWYRACLVSLIRESDSQCRKASEQVSALLSKDPSKQSDGSTNCNG